MAIEPSGSIPGLCGNTFDTPKASMANDTPLVQI